MVQYLRTASSQPDQRLMLRAWRADGLKITSRLKYSNIVVTVFGKSASLPANERATGSEARLIRQSSCRCWLQERVE